MSTTRYHLVALTANPRTARLVAAGSHDAMQAASRLLCTVEEPRAFVIAAEGHSLLRRYNPHPEPRQ